MSLSYAATKDLKNIFNVLSIDWLEDGNYEDSTFCKGKFVLNNDFDIEDLIRESLKFIQRYDSESEKACLKLRSLIEFSKKQNEIWESFSFDTKLEWMNKTIFTRFPMVLYKEIWDFQPVSQEEKDTNSPAELKNKEIKESKEKINAFFQQLSFFDSSAKTMILNKELLGNIIESKYSHVNFLKAIESVSKIQILLQEKPTQLHLKQAKLNSKIPQYVKNTTSLEKQCSLFLDIANKFIEQGKSLVATQISLDQEFFDNNSIVFHAQEIKDNEKLNDMLFEFIKHNGLYYLDLLLQVNLYLKNPGSQRFFLHSPFKLKSNNSDVILIQKEGEAESIKTIAQGRIGSLANNIKSTPYGNKRNHQLSKYELIGRILKNKQSILLTYDTLKEKKALPNDLAAMARVVEELPIYKEEDLELLDQKTLERMAQQIFGLIATMRRIQQKYI